MGTTPGLWPRGKRAKGRGPEDGGTAHSAWHCPQQAALTISSSSLQFTYAEAALSMSPLCGSRTYPTSKLLWGRRGQELFAQPIAPCPKANKGWMAGGTPPTHSCLTRAPPGPRSSPAWMQHSLPLARTRVPGSPARLPSPSAASSGSGALPGSQEPAAPGQEYSPLLSPEACGFGPLTRSLWPWRKGSRGRERPAPPAQPGNLLQLLSPCQP